MTILILALSVAWIGSYLSQLRVLGSAIHQQRAVLLYASLSAEVSWNAVEFRRYFTMWRSLDGG